MKHITSLVLALILALSAVSCEGGEAEPAGTAAGTTVETTTAGTTAEDIAETTAARTEPIDIDSLLAGYQLHRVASDELDDFRNAFPRDDVLGKVAVEVTDIPGLYLLMEDVGANGKNVGGWNGWRDRVTVHRVICGQTVQDCEIPFVFGGVDFRLLRADDITVVGQSGYYSYSYLFHEDGCVHIPTGSGRDGGSPLLYLEEGTLMYRTVNPKYMMVQTQYSMLDVVEDVNDWYNEWGTVTVENGEVIMTKTGEQLVGEDYDIRETFYELKAQTDEYTLSQDFMMFDTFDELLEYNRLKARVGEAEALLSVIPVYEVSYEEDSPYNKLDTVGEEEYRKFAAGEEYSRLYAIRFTEYPDTAIIGQVVTNAESDNYYDQRTINSVIWNGVRYDTPNIGHGPAFNLHITHDFICIVSAASSLGQAYYVYDGGTKVFMPSDVLMDGQYFYIHENEGVMEYMIFSKQFASARHIGNAALYLHYETPDDHYYDRGTIQLIDGKIKYVAEESYTVGEWFNANKKIGEESGCETIEEYIDWLRDCYENERLINESTAK